MTNTPFMRFLISRNWLISQEKAEIYHENEIFPYTKTSIWWFWATIKELKLEKEFYFIQTQNVLHFQFNGENKDWLNWFGKIFNFWSYLEAGKKIVLVWTHCLQFLAVTWKGYSDHKNCTICHFWLYIN